MNAQLAIATPITQPQPVLFRGRPTPTGRTACPLKGIFYGDNGVGKTSTLAKAQNPIIADMEGNCGHIEVAKERITDLSTFHEFLDYLFQANYNTFIIDSLDALQTILSEKILRNHTDQELSWGKGAAIWTKYIKEIVDKLEKLHSIKRMNILFTAHWKVKPANNPMTEQYDRYDLRLNEQMRTEFCNWVQFICLLLKDTAFEDNKQTGFGKKRAKSIERRVLYTHGNPTYYGKNVFNLPEKILMEDPAKGWEQFTNNVRNFYSK
jgi:DNA primase